MTYVMLGKDDDGDGFYEDLTGALAEKAARYLGLADDNCPHPDAKNAVVQHALWSHQFFINQRDRLTWLCLRLAHDRNTPETQRFIDRHGFQSRHQFFQLDDERIRTTIDHAVGANTFNQLQSHDPVMQSLIKDLSVAESDDLSDDTLLTCFNVNGTNDDQYLFLHFVEILWWRANGQPDTLAFTNHPQSFHMAPIEY